MTIWTPESDYDSAHTRGKPAAGRPVLFAVMLIVAAALVLTLLVLGPMLELPIAAASAAGVVALVITAWAVAGPKL